MAIYGVRQGYSVVRGLDVSFGVNRNTTIIGTLREIVGNYSDCFYMHVGVQGAARKPTPKLVAARAACTRLVVVTTGLHFRDRTTCLPGSDWHLGFGVRV